MTFETEAFIKSVIDGFISRCEPFTDRDILNDVKESIPTISFGDIYRIVKDDFNAGNMSNYERKIVKVKLANKNTIAYLYYYVDVVNQPGSFSDHTITADVVASADRQLNTQSDNTNLKDTKTQKFHSSIWAENAFDFVNKLRGIML